MRARTLVAVAGIAIVACSAYDQACTCGGNWRDPFARATPTTVAHGRGDHCVCRCDDTGDELLMPPFDKNCSAYEVACTTSDGRSASLVCR